MKRRSRGIRWGLLLRPDFSTATMADGDRSGAVITSASISQYSPGAGSLPFGVCTASGVDFRWMWWPDQDLVNPASPVLLLKSPLGRSAVPRTVLRLSTLLIPSLVTGSGNEFMR
ncbi:hypothetical protein Rs2_29210 [Raphanus sativus]|nr:hypothetical protein Rs2_29210 [Raphanus sativus]